MTFMIDSIGNEDELFFSPSSSLEHEKYLSYTQEAITRYICNNNDDGVYSINII